MPFIRTIQTNSSSIRSSRHERRSHKATLAVLAACLLAAGLATTAPGGVALAQTQQTNWYINDGPVFGPEGTGVGWLGGDPVSRDNGYGPGKYYNDSEYAYTSAVGGHDPAGSWARWDMGNRVGTQELYVYVPGNHASARVRYKISLRSQSGTTSSGRTDWVNQADLEGWHSLGRWSTNGRDTTISVLYNESEHATGRSGVLWRSVGIDAMAMRCVDNCGSTTTQGVPGTPRNLRLVLTDDNSFRITWDPPASDGGSAITEYTREMSRPRLSSDVGPWQNSYNHSRNSRSETFHGRNGATYTVEIAARNAVGTGASAIARITTQPVDGPPPTPTDLVVQASGDRRVLVTWNLPGGSNTSYVTYEVRVSRGRDGGDGPWSNTWTRSNQNFSFTGRSGVPYTFRVTTIRNSQRSDPTYYRDVVVLQKPEVTVGNEARSWIVDDPDSFVNWISAKAARSYQLDWRYMEIDTDRLRVIYRQLSDGQIDNRTRENLTAEANGLLVGTEIAARRIGGDSAPNADADSPEGYFDVKTRRYSINTINGSSGGGWNPESLSHRIHSRNDNYILQARVRPIGAASSIGPWSDWAFHPDSQFAAGCRALDFYNNIKDILKAIDVAGWVVTIAGIGAAAFTGGGSVAASQGTKEALKFVAKEIAKKVVREVTLRQALKNIIKSALQQASEKVATQFLGFVFGCATFGLGLSEEESREMGYRIVDETWDNIKETNWSKTTVEALFDLPGG